MHIAAGFNHPYVCEKLLLFGADINAQDDDGNTPLHLAVRFSSKRSAKYLLKHGADATIKNKRGQLPLEATD